MINEAAVDSSGLVHRSTTGFPCRISVPTNTRDLCALLLTLRAAVVSQCGTGAEEGTLLKGVARTKMTSPVEWQGMIVTMMFACYNNYLSIRGMFFL